MLRVLFATPLLLFPACSASPHEMGVPKVFEVTIDGLVWAKDILGPDHPELLGHLRDWESPPTLHQFTGQADKVFYLSSGDHEVTARTGTGGVTSGRHGKFIILSMGRGLLPGREYELRPRNGRDDYRWRVAEDVRITF